MSNPLNEVRFWLTVIENAKRTVFCSPEMESRVKTFIDARGLGGMLTVKVSPHVPEDQIYLADENALNAAQAESIQKMRYPL